MRRTPLVLAALWALSAACHRADTSRATGTPSGGPPTLPRPAPAQPGYTLAAGTRGAIHPLDRAGLDANDVGVIARVEDRLSASGHSFVAHRDPIEQMPVEMQAAGADLEVTYVGADAPMQVIVLVLRDPATARRMAPVLASRAIPSSTWVIATWSGRGVLLLVADTGGDDASGARRVREVVAALSS